MTELLGSRVVVPGSTRGSGILKYVGPIQDKSGVFAGIELQGPIAASRGKNNGSVDGVQYFEVQQPMSGLFIPWERLRSANPKLPRYEDAGRPVSSYSGGVRTPSSRPSSPIRTVRSQPRSQSPQLSQQINIAKRRTSSNDLGRSNGAPRSAGGSRSDSGDLFSRTRSSYDGESAKREINELRAVINAKDNELQERDSILSGLQSTVADLQAVLSEMEEDLQRKNDKIAQQKAAHESARQEWRKDLSSMLAAQQEAEELYEQHLQDLKREMGSSGAKESDSARISELEESVRSLTARNEELKAELESRSVGTSTLTDEGRQELEKSLERLQQDVASLEVVIEDSQAKVKSKDARIVELEIELDELRQKEVDSLSSQVKAMSVNEFDEKEKELTQLRKDLETAKKSKNELEASFKSLQDELNEVKKEKSRPEVKTEGGVSSTAESDSLELRKQIEDLTHELKMRPTFEELSELQAALDEVESLHQKSFDEKSKKLQMAEDDKTRLQQEIESLQRELERSKKSSTPTEKEQTPNPSSMSNGSSKSYLENDTLGIYKPPEPVDPSRGKSNWCGLCERDGHSSLNCPYENDIF